MNKFHIKKDYYGGALMILIGLSAVFASIQYKLGSLSHMGPGFFPCAVGSLLTLTGVLIAIAAGEDKPSEGPSLGHPAGMPDIRGGVCIILSILAFIGCGRYLGLLPATFAVVFISALGDRQNTVKQALIISAIMMVIAAGVFWYALQLQMPLYKWDF